jgi:hypothetical protein
MRCALQQLNLWANCCREQVQQILEANSPSVMRNNRPLWLVDSFKTLYVAHTGKSLSLPESCL